MVWKINQDGTAQVKKWESKFKTRNLQFRECVLGMLKDSGYPTLPIEAIVVTKTFFFGNISKREKKCVRCHKPERTHFNLHWVGEKGYKLLKALYPKLDIPSFPYSPARTTSNHL